ncbi:MAG: single-stranded DNA-binding protein [Promethearchaeota archaeon]
MSVNVGSSETSVGELSPRSREVNVKVKVVKINEVREVTSRRDGSINRVTEALVGDETGSIFLTLWNENIDKVQLDSTIKIENGYCNLFKGNMRLNIGRYGSLSEIEEDITANTENNLSDKMYEDTRYRGGRGGRSYGGGRGYSRDYGSDRRRRY